MITQEKIKTMDPMILLSMVNMKLRDEFNSLKDLTQYYDVSDELLCQRLKDYDYHYDDKTNQFV